jgi:uncharacterized protein (TIGR02117 family)
VIRAGVGLVSALVTLIGVYLLAGLAGAAIPANAGWTPAAQGVRVYVVDNGIHTDIVVPRGALGPALAARLRPGDLADPAQAARSHVAFGWGDRDFYLNTPTWADVNPWRVGRALVGAGETVMHVSYHDAPREGPRVKALVLREGELARLVAAIEGSFGEGAAVRGYGAGDAFYVARGGYSLVHTCNGWTGAALRNAGVKMGAWTPFPYGVMLWL